MGGTDRSALDTSDSHIEFEVWLPVAGWNGNVLGVGNGGFAGALNYISSAASNVPGMTRASRQLGAVGMLTRFPAST